MAVNIIQTFFLFVLNGVKFVAQRLDFAVKSKLNPTEIRFQFWLDFTATWNQT